MHERRKYYQLFGAILSSIILLLVSSISALHSINLEQLAHPYPDGDSSLIQQINCQLEALPEYGQIGYLIRPDGSLDELGIPGAGYRFFLTQSLLAPRMIDKSMNHKWIVANLINPDEMSQVAGRINAVLAKQCGADSAVFKRAAFP